MGKTGLRPETPHEKKRWSTVRFIYHKTRGSKELAKTKIVGPNLEI